MNVVPPGGKFGLFSHCINSSLLAKKDSTNARQVVFS